MRGDIFTVTLLVGRELRLPDPWPLSPAAWEADGLFHEPQESVLRPPSVLGGLWVSERARSVYRSPKQMGCRLHGSGRVSGSAAFVGFLLINYLGSANQDICAFNSITNKYLFTYIQW